MQQFMLRANGQPFANIDENDECSKGGHKNDDDDCENNNDVFCGHNNVWMSCMKCTLGVDVCDAAQIETGFGLKDIERANTFLGADYTVQHKK